MIRTVVQGDLYVNNRVTCEHAAEHCALNTLVDRRNIFLRDRAADNGIDKLVALFGVRIQLDLNMTVLAAAAGLTGILFINIGIAGNGLLISNLRLARCV